MEAFAEGFPVPFDGPVSLLPEARWGLLPQGVGQRSVFWHAATSTNTLLLTWQNACVGRDVNCPTNFQAELFPDGRLAYRYPGIERSYTPIDPCDYDGDGLANEIDPDPLTANGNCFGQGEAWLRATFTNADEMVGAGYTNWVSGWVGANVQNGRYQLNVNFEMSVRNADDALRPTAVKLGVFPMTLAQSNYPLNTNTTYSATDWGVHTNQLIKSQEVAYITGEPAAPQLSVKLQGLPNWITNSWSASIVSERSNYRFDGIDDRFYANTNLVGGSLLDIKDWMNEIIGGKVSLTSKVQNVSINEMEFYIRGKNPLDEEVVAYIDTHVPTGVVSYAWKIAKHESIQLGRIYNQFNVHEQTGSTPNWGYPHGWGISQIDKGSNGCVTAEIYNWRTNILAMAEKLREVTTLTENFLGYYAESYSTNSNWSTPPSTNVLGEAVSPEMWSVLTLYNGVSGVPSQRTPSHPRRFRSPLQFDADAGIWIFHQNNINPNYVRDIVRDSTISEVP